MCEAHLHGALSKKGWMTDDSPAVEAELVEEAPTLQTRPLK